jgi:hypothetical protein
VDYKMYVNDVEIDMPQHPGQESEAAAIVIASLVGQEPGVTGRVERRFRGASDYETIRSWRVTADGDPVEKGNWKVYASKIWITGNLHVDVVVRRDDPKFQYWTGRTWTMFAREALQFDNEHSARKLALSIDKLAA